jgi:hypothetical protein
MDYEERSSVWKTHRFLATSCHITVTSSLEYILTRKCPLPYFRLILWHWHYRAFLLNFEGSPASKDGKKGRFRALCRQ